MSRVQHWFRSAESDPLDWKCWLSHYKGMTWRQVIDTDLAFVEWLIFDSNIALHPRLYQAIESAVADLLPGPVDRSESWDHFD